MFNLLIFLGDITLPFKQSSNIRLLFFSNWDLDYKIWLDITLTSIFYIYASLWGYLCNYKWNERKNCQIIPFRILFPVVSFPLSQLPPSTPTLILHFFFLKFSCLQQVISSSQPQNSFLHFVHHFSTPKACLNYSSLFQTFL